jgi:O-acetylhomoserine (thiol)-lyase
MKKETIAIQYGYDKEGFSTMAVPIYQTTAYAFRDAKHGADLFALKELGPIYTRLTNPTNEILEKRYAKLEGGEAAICTASGQSAAFYSIANLAEAGDNIIISDKLYGGSVTLFKHTIKRFGIEAKVFNSSSADDLESQIDSKTKAIFFESLSNPQIDIPNIKHITKIAKKHKIISICDNTVATAVIFSPFKFGVDVIIHSTSKYTTGQGLALGGIVIERENLNDFLKNNQRYSHFNEPDESYHGLVYTDLSLPAYTLRIRLSLMRDIGATPSPFNSWLLIQGLETLSIRMKEHSANALKIASFLDSHKKIKSVFYPALKSSPQNKRLNEYFNDGLSSGLISFEVDDYDKAVKVIDNTKIFSIVVNIGDSKSIITHPASTTHQQLNESELKRAGVSPSLIRISVGLENSDDLITDLKQALEII